MQTLPLIVLAIAVLALGFVGDARGVDVPGSLSAQRLRVEHLADPLGIDIKTPRFGWEVASSTRGDRQTAYQIVVGEDSAAVQACTGSMWDSGKVDSSETSDLVYAGTALSSHQSLFWAVRVWDARGQASAWSSVVTFSTGYLDPAGWRAAWIGFDAARDKAVREPATLDDASWIMFADDDVKDAPAGERVYEHTITLPADAKITTATFDLAADDHFRVEFNGKEIGHSAGVDAWRTVHTIDVAETLNAGANAIRVTVDNAKPGATGLLAKIKVTLGDGAVVEQATDGNWRVGGKPAKVVGKVGVAPWGVLQHKELLPPVPMLRRSFAIDKPIRRATLYSAELGIADVYLNGERISDDRFASGWTDYAKRVYYRAYDVTGRLNRGANAIGAMLADGWYSGYVGYSHARDHYGKHARYAAELRIDYADGTSESILTDEGWKAAISATKQTDFLLGEMYDARDETVGWSNAKFDDSTWAKVDVGTDEVKPLVQWHPSQPVRAYQRFAPMKTTEPVPGTYVIDLGQNFAGIARLRVDNAKPGQKIVLRFAERLNPDGTIYTTNLRFARSTDTYLCRGGESETWEPRFTFHGFQYVEITGLTSPPTPETITGIALASETPIVGSFECSDEMLNRLHANILYTQRSNFIDIPTDCPQRDERLGWTADAQVYINAAILNADVQPFFSKWLLDLSDAQRDDGQFPKTAPLKVGGDDGGPAWADAGVICPWAIFDAYGDKALLTRQYPSMKKFVEYCEKRSGDELLPPKDYHSFGDWLSINADTPKDVIYMAYLAHSAKLTANAARVLENGADARRFDELFVRAKKSFHHEYVTPDGRIKGDTQACYVLAIAYELVDGADREAAAKFLVENIEARGNHLSTGFLGTKELMLVLSQIGRHDVAFRLLHNETFPSWGFSIKQGATSIWERWDGWTPEHGFQDPGMNSFAHYSFGAVYQWMAENIGGIRAITDASRSITIAPQIDPKLTWAKVGYHGPRGEVRSEWKRDGARLTWDVIVPANVAATIVVPAAKDAMVTEGGKPIAEAEGITVEGRDDRNVTCKVGGGTYRFESTIYLEGVTP